MLGGMTRCALLRYTLTTMMLFPGPVLLAAGIGAWSAAIVLVRVTGVPGAIILSMAGVTGAGKLPSAAGLQPVRKTSAMVDRVCSSVTHAAESYRSGIFEPFSQWPRVSSDAFSKKPRDASCAPAVTCTCRQLCGVNSMTVRGLSPPYNISSK